jgi:glycosyltransferase involved in cell wall biosynthesis
MNRSLSILMISHHRRHKAYARPHAMATHLVERGHRVTLMVISENRRVGFAEDKWDGVRIIETPDLLWGRLRSGWDMWDLLNREVYLRGDEGPYDLIHCFETRPVTIYPALQYCHRHNLPLVTDWNDWWGRGGLVIKNRPSWYSPLFGGIETYFEEAFRKKAIGLTVISSALGRRAIGLGVPPERICILPGGAFSDFFLPRQKEICRNKFGMPLSTPILGYSSVDSMLDLEIVLHALSIVAKRYPAVKLIITGKKDSSINQLAESIGVEDNIYLTGFLPYEDVPWVLGCADLFVLPFPDTIYNVGRWPNKMGDYMSLGRPTISNPVGDIKTLFENHAIGLLASEDPASFAEKIIYIIEHPDTAENLGNNARNLAVKEYEWKTLICRLENFYYSILNNQTANDNVSRKS